MKLLISVSPISSWVLKIEQEMDCQTTSIIKLIVPKFYQTNKKLKISSLRETFALCDLTNNQIKSLGSAYLREHPKHLR